MKNDTSLSDAKEAWLPLFAISAGTFATVTTEFLPVGLLPQISDSLDISLSRAAWMIAIPGLTAAVAAPLLLVGVGQLNRRWLLLLLTALTAVSNLLSSASHSFVVLMIARLILGVCVGGFWAFAANVGRQLVSVQSQSRATAIILAGISAGTVCGLPAGTWVGAVTSWRTAFAINCLLAAMVFIAQAISLPSLPTARVTTWLDLLGPVRSSEVRTTLVCTFLVILGYFAGYTYLTPYLTEAFRLTPSRVPSLLLAYGVAGLAGTFLGEQLLRKGPRWALLVVCTVLTLTMAVGAHIGSGFLCALGFAMIVGAAFGALPMSLTSWMFEATPRDAEAGQVLLVIVFQLAIAFGSGMGGIVVRSTGIPGAMTAGAVAVLLGALCAIPLRRIGTRVTNLPPAFGSKPQ